MEEWIACRRHGFVSGRSFSSGLYLAVLLNIWLLNAWPGSAAEATWEYSVQLTAEVSSGQIVISWPQDTYAVPQQYVIYRKDLAGSSWGPGVTLPGSTTRFVDDNVVRGQAYEYQVHKIAAQYQGFGYICAGSEIPMPDNRGKMILLVDQTFAGPLSAELALLAQDLVGDGWEVIRLDVARDTDVATVRSMIQGVYYSDPANVKALFLFGHIPVPYSGYIMPDEHAEHRGAWPADVFYGDMDGSWTDYIVNTTAPIDRRNWNVPGDGKFDQSNIPSWVELQVGRVDLSSLPGRLTWNGNPTLPGELDLLRQYLAKNHAFRHKQFSLPARALVYDGFGIADGEALAASAWRNFAPSFGPQNISQVQNAGLWLSRMNYTPCLWAFACGSGTHNSMAGIGTRGADKTAITPDLVTADPKAAFFMGNGSWFGDWDHEDNFMRAFLATPSYGLAFVWAGSPHWFLHHMALGETIGFGTQLTQNTTAAGLYRNQKNPGVHQVHIALMGDPTLRMHPVAPPSNLAGSAGFGSVNISWSASSDAVLGYHVYRSAQSLGPFQRLTSSLLASTSFHDPNPLPGQNTYLVRAVKRETSASGTYFNPSQGAFITLEATAPPPPTVTVVATDPAASRAGNDPATFTFSRTGPTADSLSVQFNLTGTASPWLDYRRQEGDMPESFVIPAGASSAALTIYPVAAAELVGEKNVTLTLATQPDYQVGSPDSASAAIAGNAVPVAIERVKGQVRLFWPSIAGNTYRIAYKDDILAPGWQFSPSPIQAEAAISAYEETPAIRRYYRVFQAAP